MTEIELFNKILDAIRRARPYVEEYKAQRGSLPCIVSDMRAIEDGVKALMTQRKRKRPKQQLVDLIESDRRKRERPLLPWATIQ